MDSCSNGCILLMGGTGERFGSKTPKQFVALDNKPLFLHTFEVFSNTRAFDQIVLVTHKDWIQYVQNLVGEKALVVEGGKTRQESSWLGLNAFKQAPDIVMIHDAVRPFVTPEIIFANLKACEKYGAVDTCIPSADTLVYAPKDGIIESIPPRGHYLRGQTPQTFRFSLLKEAHLAAIAENLQNATDDCQLALRMRASVHVVPGDERNIKITSSLDLSIARDLISTRI